MERAVGRLVWKSVIISGWVSAYRDSQKKMDLSLYVLTAGAACLSDCLHLSYASVSNTMFGFYP